MVQQALSPTSVRSPWGAPRRLIVRGVLAVVVLAALVWAFSGLGDAGRLAGTLRTFSMRPDLILLFAASYVAAFWLRAVAWRELLPGGPATGRLFAMLHVALLVNHILPAKAVDFARVGLATRRGVPAGEAAGSPAITRVLDFGSICLIAIVFGLIAGGDIRALLAGVALPAIAIVGGGAALVALRGELPAGIAAKLPPALGRFVADLRRALAAATPGRLVLAGGVTLVSWVLEGGVLWAVAQAAGVPLSPVAAVAVTALTLTVQAVQVTPGGIGVYEAAQTAALFLVGVDPATGLALAIATHGLKYVYSLVAGVIGLGSEALPLMSGGKTPALGRPDVEREAGQQWIYEAVGKVPLSAPVGTASERAAPPVRLIPSEHSTDSGNGLGGLGTLSLWLAGSRTANSARAAWPVDWDGFRSLRGRIPVLPVGAMALGAALLAGLLVAPPAGPEAWASLALGALAALPLAGLASWHHLPRGLLPVLVLPSLAFVLLFGWPLPEASLIALLVGSGVCWLARPAVAVPVWAVWLAPVVVAGGREPGAVALFGVLACGLTVFIRQWWLSNHALPAGPPVAAGARIAVVIPVLNERATIGDVVAGIPRGALAERGYAVDVLVIDDGSTDGSGEIARAAGADRVLRHPHRRGLGAALRTGLHAARDGGYAAAVYLDADGEYDPADLPAIVEPIVSGQADYVLGSRLPHGAAAMCRSRRFGNRVFTGGLVALTGRRIRDGQTGYRAFSARAIATAEIIHDYNYAQVLTLDLLRKRQRLAQVPIGYRTRDKGTSFIRYRQYLRRVLPAIAREVLSA